MAEQSLRQQHHKRNVMKIIVLLVLIVKSHLFAYCDYKDCTAIVQQQKEQAIQKVKNSYDQLNESMDKMEQRYSEYQEVLEDQNKLLKDIRDLKMKSNEYERKILFLLKQNNLILDKTIGIDYEESYKK